MSMTKQEYRALQKEVEQLYRKRINHRFEEGDFERYQELQDRLYIETKARGEA